MLETIGLRESRKCRCQLDFFDCRKIQQPVVKDHSRKEEAPPTQWLAVILNFPSQGRYIEQFIDNSPTARAAYNEGCDSKGIGFPFNILKIKTRDGRCGGPPGPRLLRYNDVLHLRFSRGDAVDVNLPVVHHVAGYLHFGAEIRGHYGVLVMNFVNGLGLGVAKT